MKNYRFATDEENALITKALSEMADCELKLAIAINENGEIAIDNRTENKDSALDLLKINA